MKYINPFSDLTGMYNDWDQLNTLPEIDTLIDIGVGDIGTPELYERFNKAKLILIDPLIECNSYIQENLLHRDQCFINSALGLSPGVLPLNIFSTPGLSTFLKVSDINFTDKPIEKREVAIDLLDNVIVNKKNLGSIGIKIDTEGYELDVIKGSPKTLSNTKFVLAEVRHNHESLHGVYKLHEFILEMFKNKFVLTKIFTAKPFIADLCFQPIEDL
ncbi:MAG: FkbM family methyltransferase [Flavobacteriales bacterium]|nr:FkbM family methyltransferase [Flavobacteriales bacterium]